MAGVRKKQSRNPPRDDLRHPILYRHQDCIPNPKLLQNCEKHSLSVLKSNQVVECCGKLAKDQESIDTKNKPKLSSSKVKNDNKTDKSLPASKVNPQQPGSAVGNSEELSKARKRRLRKRRLLVSLAPPPNTNIKSDSAGESTPHQTNSVPRPIPRPSGAAPPPSVPSVTKPGEQQRPSIKEFRKRLDKSGSRNKSIKSKTLLEPPSQTKADLIKSLEEKKLSSLLQTLVPLANVSPKKEKPLSHFSFPEKRLNPTDKKVDKDGVFYFGETKHQLEKLASGFNKTNPSLIKEKSECAQNTGLNKNCFSVNKPINFENYVPSFNFSALSSDKPNTFSPVKQNLFTTEPVPQTSRIENKRVFPGAPCEYQIKEHVFKSPVLKDLNQFPTQVLNLATPLNAPLTSFGNTLSFGETKPTSDSVFKQTEENPQNSCGFSTPLLPTESKYCLASSLENVKNGSEVNSLERLIIDCHKSSISLLEGVKNNSQNKPFLDIRNNSEGSNPLETANISSVSNSLESVNSNSQTSNLLKSVNNNPIIMKSTGDMNKSNKTREEIMLEREAKKAAKLAAKAKHKANQTSKTNNVVDVPRKSENNVVVNNQKEEKLTDKNDESTTQTLPPEGLEVKANVNTVPSNNRSSVSSTNKESTSDLAVTDVKELRSESSTKSKSELRAERRAKQEAQRAAKTLSKTEPSQQPKVKEKTVPRVISEQPRKTEKKQELVKVSSQPKSKLFSHLYQEKTSLTSDNIQKAGGLHPAFVRLGVQYSTRVVVGSNARCIALLHALKQMVSDYTTPSEKEFSRGLEEELGNVTAYLNQCRPLSVSMKNSLRYIKRNLTQLPNNISDIEARQKMCDVVDTYIQEQIDKAGEAICIAVYKKIEDGDVILTYGCSSLVYKILVESHQNGTKFRVVVVDGLPWREGREMLRRLVDKGLSCSYVLITGASFIMGEASKVLLGAHALLTNGYVMSRAGSSQMALLARAYNIPVLVCCETHKFCERVQTDAFLFNELGDVSCDSVKDKERGRLIPLSIAYDITPPDLVSAVVTELAVVPCTSVPVVLRIKPTDC
ncbi:Eukaryotic translation initiation factor 2B, subunit 4 delta, 67kDa [Homalodisca vitripennis]|nr:Eukaryotic translation initiation factor 2B, subunit 4 delta, 67kDa [Homalodisca vitripennis]